MQVFERALGSRRLGQSEASSSAFKSQFVINFDRDSDLVCLDYAFQFSEMVEI
jgi:hypothetical protein